MHGHLVTRRTAVGIVAALLAGLVAAPARTLADSGDVGDFRAGEFLVELEDGADAHEVNVGAGGVADPEPLAPGSTLHRFRLDPSIGGAEGVDRLVDQDGVQAAQPNLVGAAPEFLGTRRMFWADLAGPTIVDPSGAAAGQAALGAAGLVDGEALGAGVVVAVLDTGIDASHPAFSGRVLAAGYDFVDGDSHPDEVSDGRDQDGNGTADDAFGHGTHVAGIVAMVAPEAALLPIRVIDDEGTTDLWTVLRGLQFAVARGARVANLSLGGLALGDLVEKRIEAWAEGGLVMVAAAGNDGTDARQYPAAAPGVLAVTAIDGSTGARAGFANHGSWIDLAAPGVGVVSAFPGGRAARWGGTSSAAPVVSGVAALVLDVMGPATATDDLVDRITSTARPDGLPNVSAYGRVDVGAAVRRAALG